MQLEPTPDIDPGGDNVVAERTAVVNQNEVIKFAHLLEQMLTLCNGEIAIVIGLIGTIAEMGISYIDRRAFVVLTGRDYTDEEWNRIHPQLSHYAYHMMACQHDVSQSFANEIKDIALAADYHSSEYTQPLLQLVKNISDSWSVVTNDA